MEPVGKDANAELAFEEMAGGPVQLVSEHRQEVKERWPERWFRAVQGRTIILHSIAGILLDRQGRVSHGFEHRTKICSRKIHAGV